MGDGPNSNAKHSKYSIQDGQLVRAEHCPYCGPGIFLAVHSDRMSCGRCGYSNLEKEEEE